MERIINYVYNAGLGIFAVGFALDLIIKSTGKLAEFKTSAEYLWKCGALLFLIQIFYRFIHWKKYERENKSNLILFAILIVIAIIASYLKK